MAHFQKVQTRLERNSVWGISRGTGSRMVSDENDDPSNYNGMKRIREMEREEKELERLAKSSFVGRRHLFF